MMLHTEMVCFILKSTSLKEKKPISKKPKQYYKIFHFGSFELTWLK